MAVEDPRAVVFGAMGATNVAEVLSTLEVLEEPAEGLPGAGFAAAVDDFAEEVLTVVFGATLWETDVSSTLR